jgi:hypothetical protein
LDTVWKKHVAAAFATQAGLNVREKELAVFDSTRLQYRDFGQHGIAVGILGLISVIVEEWRPDFCKDHRDPKEVLELTQIHRQDRFSRLMDIVGIDYGNLKTAKKKVREQIPRYS